MTTRMRILCLERGPQYKIAAACDIAPARISEYCMGKPIPDKHLIRLCEYFKLDPEDIVGEDTDSIFDLEDARPSFFD